MLSALTLTCHQPEFTCPNSPVSCECQGFVRLTWSVIASASGTAFQIGLGPGGSIVSIGSYTVVLCNVTGIDSIPYLSSKLNFTLSENTSVECNDNTVETERVSLQMAGISDYVYCGMI